MGFNSTPVSHLELELNSRHKSLDENSFMREEEYNIEVYTEEHQRMLGNTDMSWTLFVDGYGKDGKRIFDQVRGKYCHQCRQTSLGVRTSCCRCNIPRGQFCGDCLYTRYGENVLEANANPDWICPVCRGICNCGKCRRAKGLPVLPAPQNLYQKISNLGYKSVAHYLIQTHKANTDSDNDVDIKFPSSAKSSVPFLDTEVTTEERGVSKQKIETLKVNLHSEFDTTYDGLNCKILEEILPNEEFGDSETAPKSVVTTKPLNDPTEFHEKEIKKEDAITPETSKKRAKKRVVNVTSPDSIGGRLRQRRSE